MFTDMMGNVRYKLGLHLHTTRSDGRREASAVIAEYREAGYDAIALTDHWLWNPAGELDGMKIISGAEYNIGASDPCDGFGVYHIVALGCEHRPDILPVDEPATVAAAIHEAGGIAVLAHPAWSLNDPAVVAAQPYFDATEIFNTVSGVHFSFRPDSSAFCDLLACRGMTLPLLATDDAHYYDGQDDAVSFVCVRAESGAQSELIDAIKRGDFYASQGPELHLSRDGNRFILDCSPAREILFITNLSWSHGRAVRGSDLTHAEYELSVGQGRNDRFVRAEITGMDGKKAWSNYITV